MNLVPTRTLIWLGWGTALVALVAGYVPDARFPLVLLDGLIVLAALLDALLVYRRAPRIECDRTYARVLSVGRANVVTLTLKNRSRSRLVGFVADDPVDHTTSRGNPAAFVLGPHASLAIRYEVIPHRRGAGTFGAITVRYGSPLSLLSRQERTLLPAPLEVYPDVHAARALELLRRQGRQDVRMGSLRVRGGDTEFERLRPYQRGDEVRHVDWRASAKKDELVVRQFQAESNQNIVFALDIGRAMRGESGGLTQVDHALNAALLTADVALRSGDKAGMLVFDESPRKFVPPGAGRAAGRKLTRTAYDLDAGFRATDYRAALTFLGHQVRARSLFIVFTNVLEPRSAEDLLSSVRGLMPRHLPLCVFMKDMDVEALALGDVRTEKEAYTQAAAAEFLSRRESLLRYLKRAGALVLDVPPEDVTPSLVKQYLEVKARRLL